MLGPIVKFTDDSAGLEKTLRLFQGFCTIAVGLAVSASDADYWAKTRGQFALGRRYFRLLKWYPCAINASKAVAGAQRPSIHTILDTIKWSFLSLYFFLEMFTISNAMGVTEFDWGPRVQREANKCWFYSLVASIILSMGELLWLNPTSLNPSGHDEKDKKQLKGLRGSKAEAKHDVEDPMVARSKIYMQLVIDCCDLLLPGAAVGWTPAPLAAPLVVGVASTISTTVAGSQIWNRVQLNGQP